MNRIKFGFLVLLGMLLVLVATGCLGREPQRKPEEPPVRIAFALADLERDGNKTIKETVEKQKKEMRAQVTWLDAKGDPAEQQKQLGTLAEKKIKAVVLQPVDIAGAPALVEQLNRAGIKVVALENLPVNTAVDGYITSDHAMVGRLQARFVLEALRRAQEAKAGAMSPGDGQQSAGAGESPGEQGPQPPGAVDYKVVAQLPQHRPLKAAILQGDPQDQGARTITATLRAELQKTKQVHLVGVYDHPRFDPGPVAATMAELMGQGGGVDVILAGDSVLLMAAMEYLQLGGLETQVLTVGAGADEKASRALAAGQHDAEVDLQPEMLGQFALEAAVALAKTGHWQYSATIENGDFSVPARIVPVRLITAENVYLLEQRWQGLTKAENKSGAGQGSEQKGSGGDDQQEGEQNEEGQQGQQSEQSGSPEKTTLRITTQDGKIMEVEIDGKVEKIESQEGQEGQEKQKQGEQADGQKDQE